MQVKGIDKLKKHGPSTYFLLSREIRKHLNIDVDDCLVEWECIEYNGNNSIILKKVNLNPILRKIDEKNYLLNSSPNK
jgi:hypothetical protein